MTVNNLCCICFEIEVQMRFFCEKKHEYAENVVAHLFRKDSGPEVEQEQEAPAVRHCHTVHFGRAVRRRVVGCDRAVRKDKIRVPENHTETAERHTLPRHDKQGVFPD